MQDTQTLLAVGIGELDAPSAVFAPMGEDAAGAGAPLVKFVSTFIGFLTALAGLMFLIYLIFAALSWITSGGDKGKVEHAREQMTQAALGLVVVIAAYSIAGIVGGVLGINILNPIQVLEMIAPGAG